MKTPILTNQKAEQVSINMACGHTVNLEIICNHDKQLEKVGFGKNATGGNGAPTYKASNYNDLLTYFKLAEPRIIELTQNIDLRGKVLDQKTSNLTLKGNAFAIHSGMVTCQASNSIFENTIFDNKKTIHDAFQIAAWSKSITDVYIKNCEFLNGADESLDLRVEGSGSIKGVTVEASKIVNTGYACLVDDLVSDVTFYQNYLSASERNVRSHENPVFSFEMINNYIENWKRAATQVNYATKFSLINNYYSSSIAENTEILKFASNSKGDINETHTYVVGNICAQGYDISSDVKPYLKQLPYKSSGIVPIDAEGVKDLHFGVIK